MLCRLTINNFALIRHLDIEFGKSFSVITGETGAGKSIILGALSLILGSRADNINFADNNGKCSIEGTFDITRCELESFFDNNNLDYEPYCIIRREITPQGKSRAFINDTPVNLNQLKDLTGRLIDVHSQHQTLLLRENSFQLSVIDAVANNNALLKKYKENYRDYQSLKSKLEESRALNQKAQSELDYLNFVVNELQKASLQPGEVDSLESELEVQTHAEDIKKKLYQVSELLNNDEDSIIRRLKEAGNLLNSASQHFNDLKETAERISTCIIELRDIADVNTNTVEKISFNPERMQEISDRLSLIYQLQQKHHAKDVDELIALYDEFKQKIAGIESLDNQVEQLNKQLINKFKELNATGDELSHRRKLATQGIEKSILNTISLLGIKDAKFIIEWKALSEPEKEGKDGIRFLFSANKGSVPDDIARIASGGELSRLMLAVKSLISTNNLLPTIVFDEIDTGVSGEIAGKVGHILRKISENMQVIAITHLPQIAALSDEHFKVYKLTDKESTYSVINKLNKDEQIAELAMMISGKSDSTAARDAAVELLQNMN